MLAKRASTRRLLEVAISDGAAAPEEFWVCFCCTKKNNTDSKKCCVCGRSKSYVSKRDILPLHGPGGQHFRKSQMKTIFRDEGDIIETDDKQWNALHYVSAIGNRDLLQELVDMGGSVNIPTEHGHTPLHLAVESGVLSSVALCVQSGANVNAATYFEKNTPLHMAVQDGKKKIMSYLLDVGADVNVANAVGRTPLHLAAASGRSDLAHALIKGGASVDAFDAHGWTARQIAEYNGHKDLEELFVRCKLTVSQSVLKELPAADWHSSIWSEVVDQYAVKKEKLRQQEERDAAAVKRQRSSDQSVVDNDSFHGEVDSMTSTLKQMLMSKNKITMRLENNSVKPLPSNSSLYRKQIVASNVLSSATRSVNSGTSGRPPIATVPTIDSNSVVSGLTFND